jgi:hypothetical protein
LYPHTLSFRAGFSPEESAFTKLQGGHASIVDTLPDFMINAQFC